ncbi:MAG TPA: DUF5054 domain-containing protein [Chloroflexia bacterium]|nr:DUF5054 domain-containing protein [Chloroflexia bacterium]
MESKAGGTRRPLRRVVVVFKTHFDLGFTGLPHEVMRQYTGPIFSAVRALILATGGEPAHLRYNWTLPAWPLKFLLHDPTVPAETREQARRLVEEGRLHWHAWPFTTHTAFCGLEELVRGLHVSRALAEEFGRRPGGAKQTDVPGHTWATPSLLHGAGVRFLHLGANSGSHAPHVPRLFWWEGPDGSRLLTYYSPGGYGTPALPPQDWPFDTWLALQQTVDNHGPQSPEDLLRLRRTVEQGAPEAELVFGQLGDFYDSLLEHPEQLDGLPVVPYDLADTWIHGVGSMPREVARVRSLRHKLLELEVIATLLDWPGKDNGHSAEFALSRGIAPEIDAAYEQLLLFGEHTWGLDVKSTIARVFDEGFSAARLTEPYRRLESSWAAKADYVTKSEEAYARAYARVLDAWRADFERLRQKREQHPLWQPYNREFEERQVRPAGSEEDSQAPEEAVFIPPPIPAGKNVLETGSLRIEVDPASGGITSFIDATTGREWVARTGEPFAGYRYDLYSAADIAEFLRAYGLYFQDWFVHDFGRPGYPEDMPHVTSYARNFSLARVKDAAGEALLLAGGGLEATSQGGARLPFQRVSIRLSLHDWSGYYNTEARRSYDSRSLDLEYAIEGKEATPLAESTVVPFPLDLPKASFRLGQVGSVIDPARDIAEGANRYLWCVDGWVDASDDRVGMAVMPLDMPLVSIGSPGIFAFDPARVPSQATLYAHLSNTQWGTNFPQWLEGDFKFRVRLAPHAGDWRTGELWGQTSSLELNELHMRGERGVGSMPSFVERDTGLLLLSLHPASVGRGLIARYWDALGTHRRVTLSLPQPVARVWRCDLMERPVEELPLQKRPASDPSHKPVSWGVLNVAPHATMTLLLEFDKPQEAAP